MSHNELMQLADEMHIASPAGTDVHWKTLRRFSDRLRTLAQQGKAGGVAWECTGQGLKKYVTDKQFQAFTPGVQHWYKPYRCTNCKPANSPEAGVTNAAILSIAADLRNFGTPDCPPRWLGCGALRLTDRVADELQALTAPQPKDAER